MFKPNQRLSYGHYVLEALGIRASIYGNFNHQSRGDSHSLFGFKMSRSKPSDKPPKLPLPMKLVVGAVAGAVGTSCIFPIDMVKTRLQASGASKYSGPINCFQTIVRTEGGYRALYRGLNANLVGVIPGRYYFYSTRFYVLIPL